MKRKTDFVTNSSSTSFILADYRKPNNNSCKVKVEIDLFIYESKVISNIKDLIAFCETEYGSTSKEARENFPEYFEVINNGGKLRRYDVCSDGEQEEAFLCDIGLTDKMVPKDVKIIQGEGGY